MNRDCAFRTPVLPVSSALVNDGYAEVALIMHVCRLRSFVRVTTDSSSDSEHSQQLAVAGFYYGDAGQLNFQRSHSLVEQCGWAGEPSYGATEIKDLSCVRLLGGSCPLADDTRK